MGKVFDGDLTIVKSDIIRNWWILERSEHDGREWNEPVPHGFKCCMSRRINPQDADIEGRSAEWLEIAHAIENYGQATFKRCSIMYRPGAIGDYVIKSPRNTIEPSILTPRAAMHLAFEIRTKLAGEEIE